MENRDRTDAWRRNDTLEGLLGELSGLLGPAEERLNALDAGPSPCPWCSWWARPGAARP